MPTEELDPLSPEGLVVPVRPQVVDDLDDRHVRVEIGQPARPQVSGRGVAWAAVDVDGEPLTAHRGLADEERVPEVWRIEAPDDEAGRRGHVTVAATTTGPR